jgi:hypothetical protein
MQRLRFICCAVALVVLAVSAEATNPDTGTFDMQCQGDSGSEVAVRWGHPNYDSAAVIPSFVAPCDGLIHQTPVTLSAKNSEFQVETQGGFVSRYALNMRLLGSTAEASGSFNLSRTVLPPLTLSAPSVIIHRSSGPNKYGEQNFRVELPSESPASVTINAQSMGDRTDAQLAIRWGHPDFNDHAYFPLWKIKAGSPQSRTFHLKDRKSEFEIQTEGGINTTYQIAISFVLGIPEIANPTLQINHQQETDFGSSGGVTFTLESGDPYGTRKVRLKVKSF